MDCPLILYPKLFQCPSKFNRKIDHFLKNLDVGEVITLQDHHRYIQDFISTGCLIKETNNIEDEDFTHAIVFVDGREMTEEVAAIKKRNTPLCLVEVKITRVVNIKTHPKYQNDMDYEYIGRGSGWGNSYSMLEGESREEVIRKYKYDFERDLLPKKKRAEAHTLAGKTLGCFCHPQPCHGDVLAGYLNSLDEGI